MSEFRVEKRRAEAVLTLATGTTVRGCFFLAGARATQAGPERIADLLNAETGFFTFELNGQAAPHTVLYNRAQVVFVTLVAERVEPALDAGYTVATERDVQMLLSNGRSVAGNIRRAIRTAPPKR